MHEHGMCEGLVDLVQQEAAGRRVTGVRVRIGAGHAVVPEAFGQAFALAAGGTAAQDAELDLVVVPFTLDCRGCGGRTESADALAACPSCGGDVDVTGGDELVLESIRLEGGADVSRHPR
ncbi:putative hydrogenase nickel incorporation protein HypA [Microtetraspora sp. NBRC 13810]|uniref:hydrogenase maturation nickel metallochaperone HypA/HybF n=1 Tax=Microtetraspora sp. NBRC 13810 TaxID=3030990 RepID=UPI0024A3DC94|nr:hydrogenase maturation nickel metallochaperone HypA [Microtetraspora sp. NBRC 13810]GLW09273.1 putative hydrogenase nickel incorporation protein HypA [Microtetraspora sp. NBRC 13810]